LKTATAQHETDPKVSRDQDYLLARELLRIISWPIELLRIISRTIKLLRIIS